jgi:alanine racemase
MQAPSRAIIDLKAYTSNLEAVRRFVGARPGIIAIVKANAYGHGLVEISRKAAEWGVNMLGVANVSEGAQLRQAGLHVPILVLGQPLPDDLPELIRHRLTPLLSSVKTAEQLGAIAHSAKTIVPVHCKVDTGMGRQGFSAASAVDEIMFLTRISNIDIEGIATHFPAAEFSDDARNTAQLKVFRQILKQLDKQGVPYEVTHAANSAAIVNYHASVFNMVRPGLITYGAWPCPDPPARNLLEPVLRWETRVALVKMIEAGATAGYGRAWTAKKDTRIAVLMTGYADGYKYALSNRASVLIHGKRCPVRGAVSMDQLTVDVSHLEHIKAGDTATLIGRDGNEHITVLELAQLANTIPYDIMTGIGSRVQRIYTE